MFEFSNTQEESEGIADQLELPGFEMQNPVEEKSSVFSIIAARFFFFLLLLADVIWGLFSTLILTAKLTLSLLTLFRIPKLRTSTARTWLSVKRSLVCGVALIVALFSPALGIMFSCMYFLMYDTEGVDEIVPESLRDQVKSFFPA